MVYEDFWEDSRKFIFNFIYLFYLFNQFANKGRRQYNRTLRPLQDVSPNPNHTMNTIKTNYTNPVLPAGNFLRKNTYT